MSDALRITDGDLRYLADHDRTYVSVLAQALLDERAIHARCVAALRRLIETTPRYYALESAWAAAEAALAGEDK